MNNLPTYLKKPKLEQANDAIQLLLGCNNCYLLKVSDSAANLMFTGTQPSHLDLYRYANQLKEAGLGTNINAVTGFLSNYIIIPVSIERIVSVLEEKTLAKLKAKDEIEKRMLEKGISQDNKSLVSYPVIASHVAIHSSLLVPQPSQNINKGISPIVPPQLSKEEKDKLQRETIRKQANEAVQRLIGRPDCTLWSLFEHGPQIHLEFTKPEPRYYELQTYAKQLKEAGLSAVFEDLGRPIPPRVIIHNMREIVIDKLNTYAQSKTTRDQLSFSALPNMYNSKQEKREYVSARPQLVPLSSSSLPVLNNSSAPSVIPAAASQVDLARSTVKQCKPYSESVSYFNQHSNKPSAAQLNAAQDNEHLALLAQIEKLKATNATLLASIPASAKQSVSINDKNEDKAMLRGMIDFFFDHLSQYPDKAGELLRRITTDYRKVKKTVEDDIQDIIHFAFVGTSISEQDKKLLYSDLCEIHKIAMTSCNELKLKGLYPATKVAKMVYDISIDLVLQNQHKNVVSSSANNSLPQGIATLTLTLHRSNSPIHQRSDANNLNVADRSSQDDASKNNNTTTLSLR